MDRQPAPPPIGKPPRPRLTVGRLMIAVALLGSVLAVGIEWNRRVERLSRRAFYHRVNAMGPVDAFGASFERKRAWNAAMAAKYNHHASHPWLAVPPDPPQPE